MFQSQTSDCRAALMKAAREVAGEEGKAAAGAVGSADRGGHSIGHVERLLDKTKFPDSVVNFLDWCIRAQREGGAGEQAG